MKEFREKEGKLKSDIEDLRRQLAEEKKQRVQDGTEKDRDKLQATEKLRREMLKQIKMTKASLLALNDDQQHTTTRLTIHQNTQLTNELEYQSKNTEKLLADNNEMKIKIDNLNRDITIHKEVEKELAKRSHFCQKVIKRLKLENQELLEKLEGKHQELTSGHLSPNAGFATHGNKRNNALSASKTVRHGDAKKLSMQDELKSSEELINYLENKLEQHEKNLVQKKSEYEALQQEYYQL